ncbi:MAG: DegT/DnrJ/EryC1/StrS family aminotransferase [Flavihumibacter sp.]
MRPIQMVDLKRQYAHIKDDVDAAMLEVIENTAFINGKAVQQFTEAFANYLSVKHVIPCANGTDALQIAMMALGLEPGDEVITPSFTYIATTEVVALLRLKPVFVEVDRAGFCMDPEALEKAITPKTKAIVPVHLYGQSADMEKIMAIAQKHNIPVIEDNAQAIGADYYFSDGTVKKTGTIGTIGCTSFFPSKNLGCYGDGGAICTHDDALAARMRMIANHGQSVRYYHDIVGCNSRLDSIQAAVLNVKLPKLDEYITARRVRRIITTRLLRVPESHCSLPLPNNKHVFHQYTLLVEGADRDALHQFLADNRIPSMIYYPVPAHRQKMFAAFGSDQQVLPVTDWLTTRVISLPMHTELDAEQLEYITNHILKFTRNYINH